MRRQIFTEEHEAFRDMVRAFIAKEITPYHEQWERDKIVSRDVWLAAGRAGKWLSRKRIRALEIISGTCLIGGAAWMVSKGA